MSHFTVARIAAQLFNTPLLLVPETAIAIASNLADRFDVQAMEAKDDSGVIEASRFRGTAVTRREDGRSVYRTEGGTAVIPVLGELVNRGAWIGASSGLTSYEGLEAQLRAASSDPNVKSILLDMNSPGGEASGAMEIGTLVRSITAAKPVVAFVNGMAASAGYAIAAGATKIVTTPSGLTGSIGVVMLHVDRSAALAKAGVKPTLIHAGAHKVDGSSLQALPDDARARIQGAVDGVYDLFVRHVAAHRGMTQKAVRATEGGVRMGQAAVDAGLADQVGTFDDALALLAPKSKPHGDFLMTDITQAAHDAALKAATDKATADALASNQATSQKAALDATAADRKRTQAILGSTEAKGREALAQKLAFESDMTAEAAVDFLKAAPLASAAGTVRQPRLGIVDPGIKPEDEVGKPDDAKASWNSVVSQLNTAAGFKA